MKVGVFLVNDVTTKTRLVRELYPRPPPPKKKQKKHGELGTPKYDDSSLSSPRFIAHSFFLDAPLQHDGCVYFK